MVQNKEMLFNYKNSTGRKQTEKMLLGCKKLCYSHKKENMTLEGRIDRPESGAKSHRELTPGLGI